MITYIKSSIILRINNLKFNNNNIIPTHEMIISVILAQFFPLHKPIAIIVNKIPNKIKNNPNIFDE